MDIVQVTHYSFPHVGGIEMVAARLAAGLARRGHAVTWFFARTAPGQEADWEGCRRRPLAAINPLEPFGIPLPLPEPFAARAELDRALGRADAVVLHDCLSMPPQLASWLNRRSFRKPCLLVQHVGYVPYRNALSRHLQKWAYATLGKSCVRRADAVAVVARHVESFVRKDLNFPGPVHHIPNGIPDEGLPGPAPAAAEPFRLALVGRLTEKKNIPLALALTEKLREKNSLVLVMAGDGEQRPLVDAFARRHPGSVEFHGQKSPADVKHIYAGCHAVLCLGQGEGFPLSVQEGMMAGLPAVVPRESPYTDVLDEGAGAVFVPRDAEGACRAVEAALLGRRENLPALSRSARDFARRNWSLETMVERYENLLLKLTGGR